MNTDLAIVATGAANLASVRAAFARLGRDTTITDEPSVVADAGAVVLPGVGAFGPAMARLAELGLDRALRDRVSAGRPTLAVCLGLQLLCKGSDEAPGVPGLGLCDVDVRRFDERVRTPQLGWNEIEPDGDAPLGGALLRPGWACFANSYALRDAPTGWSVAWSDHGGRFVAAVERGPVLACQFHPELSGAFGRGLLERWLVAADTPVTGAAPC